MTQSGHCRSDCGRRSTVGDLPRTAGLCSMVNSGCVRDAEGIERGEPIFGVRGIGGPTAVLV